MAFDKLQKLLAQAGLGSRRAMEVKIQEGAVKVNGKVAKLGDRASCEDKIVIDGKRLSHYQGVILTRPRIIIYHKPTGQICTKHDPEGRQSVFDALPKINKGRWVMVGRLDINTLGLLIFTTDGELANRLMHPSYGIEREYAVRVFGEVSSAQIKRLSGGIELEDGMARFRSIHKSGGQGRNVWYHVSLSEGRNREIRRMFEALDLQVSRLIRVRYGDIRLPEYLSAGKSEELSSQFVNIIRQSVGMKRFDFPRSLLARQHRRKPNR